MYVVCTMTGTIEKHEATQDGEYLIVNGQTFYKKEEDWINRFLNDKRAYEKFQDAKDYAKFVHEEEIESLSEQIDYAKECLEYTESLGEEDFKDEDLQDQK